MKTVLYAVVGLLLVGLVAAVPIMSSARIAVNSSQISAFCGANDDQNVNYQYTIYKGQVVVSKGYATSYGSMVVQDGGSYSFDGPWYNIANFNDGNYQSPAICFGGVCHAYVSYVKPLNAVLADTRWFVSDNSLKTAKNIDGCWNNPTLEFRITLNGISNVGECFSDGVWKKVYQSSSGYTFYDEGMNFHIGNVVILPNIERGVASVAKSKGTWNVRCSAFDADSDYSADMVGNKLIV